MFLLLTTKINRKHLEQILTLNWKQKCGQNSSKSCCCCLCFLLETFKEKNPSFFFFLHLWGSQGKSHHPRHRKTCIAGISMRGYSNHDFDKTGSLATFFWHDHILLFKTCLYVIRYSIHMIDNSYLLTLKNKQIVWQDKKGMKLILCVSVHEKQAVNI